MAKIYKDIAETINKTKWDVVVEDTASLHIPYYFQKYPERKEAFTSGTAMSISKITIHEMIEYAANGVTFGFVNKPDVVMVVEFIGMYLKEYVHMLKDLSKNDPYVIYADKAKILLKLLTTTAEHARKQNEQKQEFKPIPQIADIVCFM